MTLLYANRNEAVPFRDELDEMQSKNPHLKVEYLIEPHRLDETKLTEAISSLEDPLIYISGPEPMVKSIAEQVKVMGIQEQNLKVDDFPGYEGI